MLDDLGGFGARHEGMDGDARHAGVAHGLFGGGDDLADRVEVSLHGGRGGRRGGGGARRRRLIGRLHPDRQGG